MIRMHTRPLSAPSGSKTLNPTSILRTFSILALSSLLLVGCGKKSEAEVAAEQREALKAEKRAQAAKAFKDLADNYPEDPNAKEAATKAAALAAPPAK